MSPGQLKLNITFSLILHYLYGTFFIFTTPSKKTEKRGNRFQHYILWLKCQRSHYSSKCFSLVSLASQPVHPSLHPFFLCFCFSLLSPSITPWPIHFSLSPSSLSSFIHTPSLFLLAHTSVFLVFPQFSQSLVLRRINKPSVAYWEPMIAAVPRRLIPPVLTPSSFYSFCLSSFVFMNSEFHFVRCSLLFQPNDQCPLSAKT